MFLRGHKERLEILLDRSVKNGSFRLMSEMGDRSYYRTLRSHPRSAIRLTSPSSLGANQQSPEIEQSSVGFQLLRNVGAGGVGSNTIKIGVGDGIVFEPSTIARECPARWADAQIDLGKLASLRREGWTSKELQAHFGFGRSKINLELRMLRGARSAPGSPGTERICHHPLFCFALLPLLVE